ncbi:MAG: hypothetical protein CSA96_01375 [Bacteroidetes bacterium]|nr:MAG: hypothetical protein CSA96_01375 [Bacteroidota bacterium]
MTDFRSREVKAILEHSETRALFISGKMLARFTGKLPRAVELVVNLDDFSVLELSDRKIVLQAIPEAGKLKKLEAGEDTLVPVERIQTTDPDSVASIIYTSGTTGRSKGVILSHWNLLSDVINVASIHQVHETDVFLSILPLAHAYEFSIGFLVALLNGASIHYIDKAPTATILGPILAKIRPTTMLTVPLIMEKIYKAKIRPALYKSLPMKAAMKFGPTRKLLSKAASKKLQGFFGGRLRFFGIGGAPLAPEVERFLIEGKFPYAIGYGLTETAPMIAGFSPKAQVFRSVGTTMAGCDIRIHEPDPQTGEGEIVVTGPNIMRGYYKDEERTGEAFTDDGYFRTGDLGYMNKNGVIYIRGRIKNMILGPNGENIYPEEIEAVINSEELVNESLVMQYKGKLVALVNLKAEVLEEQFKYLEENANDFQAAMQTKTEEILDELLAHVNEHVARNSRLQSMILQLQPFEKTPTQKIKRFLYS